MPSDIGTYEDEIEEHTETNEEQASREAWEISNHAMQDEQCRRMVEKKLDNVIDDLSVLEFMLGFKARCEKNDRFKSTWDKRDTMMDILDAVNTLKTAKQRIALEETPA